ALFALTRIAAELAEPKVAVGDEGAHAELASQGQGPSVRLLSILAFPGGVARKDLAFDAQRIRLEQSLLVDAAELQSPTDSFYCVMLPPCDVVSLAWLRQAQCLQRNYLHNCAMID